MFEENYGDDISPDKAKSGVQISCPVKSENGETLAPFCYAIEIGRSPIVAQKKKSQTSPAGNSRVEEPEIHGPVAYTLSVHAPFVITNLLPETGRFELMHAVRRTVLWFGTLAPGEQMPVHSVGLDAPLLLLLNLGFCRTPVGEGALVHHGADTLSATKGKILVLSSLASFHLLSLIQANRSAVCHLVDNVGLKSLVGKSAGAVGKVVTKSTGAVGKVVTKSTIGVGKVAIKGTRHIGKTMMTAISDSPDKRTTREIEDHREVQPSPLEIQEVTKATSTGAMGYDTGKLRTADSADYMNNIDEH